MKARSNNNRSMIESLEVRRLMTAVAEADFNNDGRLDKAVVTSPTTITVSLKNSDGSYSVSAILTSSKSRPIADIYVYDSNADGKLDIAAGGGGSGGPKFSGNVWLGNGDGTFGNRKTTNSHPFNHGGF